MCLYDSSNFTAAPVPITTPILITSVKWRANDSNFSWTGGTFNNAVVRMATAAVDYTAASTNWAANVGPDVTVVHNGPVVVNGGTSVLGVPGPYCVTINCNPPFLYDPSAGDFLIDTEHVPSNFTGGSLPPFDVHDLPGVSARRVYGSTFYPGANGIDSYCNVIEIGYVPAPGTAATNTVLGQGCIRTYTSFYELFPTPASFDLSGTGIMFIPIGNGGYVVTQGGTFLPVGSVQATPTALPFSLIQGLQRPLTVGSFMGPSGPWTSLYIISNGIVSQAAGNTWNGAPTTGDLLAGPQTAFYSQGDFDPAGMTGSGTIWFEESPSMISITWDNVKSWGVAGTNTFQFQLHPSGTVNIVWVSMTPLGANGGLMVGYSPGGFSLDPGNTDLTTLAATPIVTTTVDVPLIRLFGATRPITGTSWNLTVADIPATGALGVDIFGFSDPNVPDLSFIGAPTCGLRSSLDVLNAYVVTGASHNYGLPIPSNPTLIGFQLFTTGAVMQIPPVNAFGWITANGIKGTVGDV